MITRVPHKRHPLYVDSSSRCDVYSSKSGCPLLGQPCSTNLKPLDSFLSCFVHRWMSEAVTGELAKYSMSKTNSHSGVTDTGSSDNGSLLKASALACTVVF